MLLDAPLATFAHVNCHPLENTGTTQIAWADLLRFLRATGHEPRILPLSGPEPAGV